MLCKAMELDNDEMRNLVGKMILNYCPIEIYVRYYIILNFLIAYLKSKQQQQKDDMNFNNPIYRGVPEWLSQLVV